MSESPTSLRVVLLLRGVNVGGHRKVPMAELRRLCEEVGFTHVRTYVASGNVVADTTLAPMAAAVALEQAIEKRFGFHADVVVRPGDAWVAYLSDSPFPEAAAAEPNRVMLLLANRDPNPSAFEELQGRAGRGELVEHVRDGIWVYFASEVATSRLTPAVIEKAVGAPTTSRNWRTVRMLAGLATEVVEA